MYITICEIDGQSWRRQWHPTPVLLPGKSHGWRSLVGCSSWGRYESDTTEQLHFDFSLSCIGEGNGNPLQCSCLENPRDGGAWWAAVYGVTQSWTWLKWLSSLAAKFNAWSRGLKAGALGQPRGLGWGGEWERGSGWGTHVHPWLIHVDVWQKPPQYCKVVSLQLK